MPFRHFALILEPEDELEADRSLFPMAFSTSLLEESCVGDVEDETHPELAGNPGNDKRYESVRFTENTLPIFGQPWFLTAEPLFGVSVVFAKLA